MKSDSLFCHRLLALKFGSAHRRAAAESRTAGLHLFTDRASEPQQNLRTVCWLDGQQQTQKRQVCAALFRQFSAHVLLVCWIC